MIKQYQFYVVDSVAEKIIGSFFASSDEMANRILRGIDLNKAKLRWEDIEVYKNPSFSVEFESLSEIRSLKKGQIINYPLTDVVNGQLFEEVK